MSTRKLATPALLDALAAGWQAPTPALAEEFLLRWTTALQTTALDQRPSDNTLRFTVDLGSIRLRGMAEVPCLIVGGSDSSASDPIEEFLGHAALPGHIAFILALSDSAQQRASALASGKRFLVLDRPQVQNLFECSDPRSLLKQSLYRQIPRQGLIPYSITLPALGNMFFGRQTELDRLLCQTEVSFAVAGPSRIGKTSLLRHYESLVVRSRDPRASRQFLINLYGYADRTADSVARFIAKHIEPSQRSYRITVDDLGQFLRYHRWKLGGPLELLLDETDEVCGNQVLEALGTAAKQGFCRLVLAGRGALLKLLATGKSALGYRLELLRLEPLDEPSARALLLDPLADLGFRIDSPDELTDRVFRLTGRMPYLVQFYGERLADLAIRENTDAISVNHVELLRWDFQTAQFFTAPLFDIREPERRLIALSLLKSRQEHITIPLVREVAAQNGVSLDHQCALDLMNEMVIDNVLAWERGAFRVANEAFIEYANQLGFLDGAIDDARRAVHTARQPATVSG